MHPTPARPEKLDLVVSWSAFALLAAAAAAFAAYVPRHRDAMRAVYTDFGLKLPWAARVALDVPTAAVVATAALAVAGALVVQVTARSKRSAALLHLLLVATFGVLFLVYREAMGSPFVSLIEAMTPGAGGK